MIGVYIVLVVSIAYLTYASISIIKTNRKAMDLLAKAHQFKIASEHLRELMSRGEYVYTNFDQLNEDIEKTRKRLFE